MTATTEEMTLTRNRVEWASVPRVNLLPPEIIEGRAFRKTQMLLGGVVAGMVVLGALGTFWAQRQVNTAAMQLDTAHSRTSQLQAQERKYAEVPRVLAQLDAAKSARENALGRDVLWYRFLDELAADSPRQVSLTSLKVELADAPNGPAKDALTPADYGQVLVLGTTDSYPSVSKWLTTVTNVSGLELSRLQIASQDVEKPVDKRTVDFTGDVRIAEAALSHRYDRKAD